MPRPARPDDLFRLAVPFDPVLSPDGRHVAFSVKRTSVGHEGYRHSVWMAPTDGDTPARQVTIGGRTDRYPRFSPDGRTLAFISDRRLLVEEEPDRPKEAKDRLDCDQVFLLPLDGGEARRLTDLPRGANEFAWSPDGRSLAVVSSSLGATIAEESKKRGRPAAPKPGEMPAVGLPLHRPPRLPVQRCGLRRRPRCAPVARRRRDRRGALAGERPDPGGRARVEPGRHPDRLHGQPAPPPGPRPAFVGVHRGCRQRRGHDDRGRRGRRLHAARLDPRRPRDRRPRRPVPTRGLPVRDLAVRGGRVGRGPAWRHGPPRHERAEAGFRAQQRRDAGRGSACGPGRRRHDAPVHGAGGRQLRAVAGAARRVRASPCA